MVMHNSMWPPHSAPYLRNLPRMLSKRLHCITANATRTLMTDGQAPEHTTLKKKAGLHVAYVGTNYSGLQIQANPGKQPAIENVIHDAIFEAGMMLPTNRFSAQRLKWSRSSRTDKGVHSMGTVITCMLEVEQNAFENDPRGQSLASAINAHLPEDRVTNGFNARAMCLRRTYAYYLPLSVLEPVKRDGNLYPNEHGPVEMLTQAWEAFRGNLPFHNYTKRALYHPHKHISRRAMLSKRRRQKEADRQAYAAPGARMDNQEIDQEEEYEEDPEDDEDSAQEGTDSLQSKNPGRWDIEFEAKVDPNDRVYDAHFRRMLELHVDGPFMLDDSEEPCVRMMVTGDSFMMHQIRYMVGAAVQVALGIMPLELVHASLLRPCRISMMKAPACNLVLYDSVFRDFINKDMVESTASPAVQLTGRRLMLPVEADNRQLSFCAEQLYPAIAGLSRLPEWTEWRRRLEQVEYSPEVVKSTLTKAEEWRERRVENRAARVVAEVAEARGVRREHARRRVF